MQNIKFISITRGLLIFGGIFFIVLFFICNIFTIYISSFFIAIITIIFAIIYVILGIVAVINGIIDGRMEPIVFSYPVIKGWIRGTKKQKLAYYSNLVFNFFILAGFIVIIYLLLFRLIF